MNQQERKDSDHDVLVLVAQQVKEIHIAVNGNGQPGLRQRVEFLENWKAYITGAIALLTLLAGSGIAMALLRKP